MSLNSEGNSKSQERKLFKRRKTFGRKNLRKEKLVGEVVHGQQKLYSVERCCSSNFYWASEKAKQPEYRVLARVDI